ncbi:hypothetical protein [Sphingobacterium athyrii]|uniref:hypothetical protein n=1 Tax=Sphingobacterium athyrii TaxID=2152717 RepID=UPI0028AC56EA|nr:hypothetical protein [Sphingobacterium athyrii]
MERPYSGIATHYETPTGYSIIVPAKKHLPIIIIFSLWLLGWIQSIIFFAPTLGDFYDTTGGLSFDGIFIIVWLILAIVAGFFVMKTLIWYLIGKEIITIDREQITIARQNDILFRQKIYDLQEANRFHVEEEHFEFNFWGRRNDLGVFRNRGTIRFEYGFKTIKFANDMDQAEANHILESLRSLGYLTATNF